MEKGGTYVVLPDSVLAKKACVNVKNRDKKCVMWALLSALFPAGKNADRVSKYEQHQHVLDLTGIEFPTPAKQVQQIQQQNQELFPWGINVFSLEEDSLKPFPSDISQKSKHYIEGLSEGRPVVNLLWWNNHYCWIMDFSRFARSSITAHHGKMYFCYSCLSGFTDQQKLIEHNKYCYENTAMITPDPGKNILYFRKQQREIKMPFIIYGDFESFIVPVRSRGGFKRTNRVQKHIPASYCLNTVCVDDKYSKLSPVYRVEHVDDLHAEVHMLKYLFAEQTRIQKILDTGDQYTSINSYKTATKCYIFRKPFAQDKVPFADIFTNKYIGAVHESCRQFQKFIPVVFHNLRGYDGHFILRALGHPEIVKYCADNKIKINCIPTNSERLLSLSIGRLRFIDSIQFMNSSLDNLAKNCCNLKNTKKYFPFEDLQGQFCQEKVFKGIFPYEAFTGPDIFNHSSLPPREAFYSSLYDNNITTEQYDQAVRAWDNFHCNNFGDYHDAYLQLDVLLLSDVFEEFRITSMTQYGLDPAHYFSAPGLSWDAVLKHSQVQLELLTDPDMYLFIERGTRGGISVITKKYSRTNNKYLHDYDPAEPDKYICYLDANNLYDAAMSAPLPYGGFKWISPEEFLAATNNATAAMDPNVSYFVEVDVDYPAQLHDSHNCYPYLPEHLMITDNMLSRQQLALRTNGGCPYHKLVSSLFDKRDYICHYVLLKQALDAGLILKKVHRVLQFNHSCWLKTYIDANTTRRTAAKSDFEKDFFKLMNNSVFGKTMENVRKRVSVDVVNSVARRNKLVRGNCFQHIKRISDNLVLITKKQKTLKLNKPIYVGATVLDLSKVIMYDFHYGFFRGQFPDSTLLMTDTDSLVYEVPVEDLYQVIFDHRELFDLSDVKGKFNDATNKKVIGKFKDEFAFRPVREFCGLRSKMYSLITEDDVVMKKAKGINNNYVKNKLMFSDYLAALARTPGCDLLTVTTRGFRSYRHEVVTDEITRV